MQSPLIPTVYTVGSVGTIKMNITTKILVLGQYMESVKCTVLTLPLLRDTTLVTFVLYLLNN
jgi:hypothetical protein